MGIKYIPNKNSNNLDTGDVVRLSGDEYAVIFTVMWGSKKGGKKGGKKEPSYHALLIQPNKQIMGARKPIQDGLTLGSILSDRSGQSFALCEIPQRVQPSEFASDGKGGIVFRGNIFDTNLFQKELAPLFRKKVDQGAYVTNEKTPKTTKVVLPAKTVSLEQKPSKVLNLKNDLSLRDSIELNLLPGDYGIFLTKLFKGITFETTLRAALAIFKKTPEKERKSLSFAWVQGDVFRQELNVAASVTAGFLPDDIQELQPKFRLISVSTLQDVIRKNASGETSKHFKANEVAKIQSHFAAAVTSRAHGFVHSIEDSIHGVLRDLPKMIEATPEAFEGIRTLYPVR